MDFKLKGKYFAVTGASSGFGRAVAEMLLNEEAYIIANARRKEKLDELNKSFPGKVISIVGDILDESIRNSLVSVMTEKKAEGIFVNTGGPKAGGAFEIEMNDWDQAYQLVLRWKVDLVKKIVPVFKESNYGRIVFLESSAIKQPIDNLVLSNSMRLAVLGFVKTFSQEVAQNGITANIIAPGFHDTEAIKRIFNKKAEKTGASLEEVRLDMIRNTPVNKIGNPKDLASLALWLLSPYSSFVTGQIFTLDGGIVKGNL